MAGMQIDRKLEFNRDGVMGYRMRNNSGGTVGAGAVVIFDTGVQAGDAFTTTTAQDDALVAGVLIDTVANQNYGFVAMYGHIAVLKVNGTTDIATGDHLSTFTTAEIAAKATAGKAGKFAIALEAYSTNDSLGVIDCWLMPAARGDNSALSSQLNNDINLVFGTTDGAGTAVRFQYDTAETNDALVVGVNTASRRVIIKDYADIDTDTTQAAANDPELMLMTADHTEFLKIHTDTTGAEYDVSTGNTHELLVAGTAEYSFSATVAGILDGNSLIVGAAAGQAVGADTSTAQVLGTAAVDSGVTVGLWSATDALQAMVKFVKSGNATIGSSTIVADNELLGAITWYADDGVDFVTPAARIFAEVDGTPGANDVPGALVFSTGDGDTLTEVLRLTPAFDAQINNGGGLVVGNSAQITFNALIPEMQVLGTAVGVDGAAAVALYSATAAEGAEVVLARSKSATLGTNTIVASADQLGRILAVGADGGTGFDPAASILFEVDGTPGAATDMPGRIRFMTSPDGSQTQTEVFRIANDQNLYVVNTNGVVIGAIAQQTVNAEVPEVQILGTAAIDSTMVIGRWSADEPSPALAFAKSRNATIGSRTLVLDGDDLGTIFFYGDAGVDIDSVGASIKVEVDGTPASNSMPGRLVFGTTPSGSVTASDRLAIYNNGSIQIMNGAPKLTMGTQANFGTTQPTNAIVFQGGTAPAGAITTSSAIFASTTVMRKIIADGTVSNIET